MADKTTITGAVEQSVIALILDDPSINLSLATDAGVTSDWFEDGRCRAVWDALIAMRDAGQIEAYLAVVRANDLVRANAERYGYGQIDTDWYDQITQHVTDMSDISQYIDDMRKRHNRRAISQMLADAAQTGDLDALVSRAQTIRATQMQTSDDVPTGNDRIIMPVELCNIPGIIGRHIDYTMSRAIYPNIRTATIGAIAMVSFAAARGYRMEDNTRTPLYLVAAANSGAGKDEPRKTNEDIARKCGAGPNVGDTIASGEGLQDWILERSKVLLQNDEFDTLLRAINADKGGNKESLVQQMLTVATSAGGYLNRRRTSIGKDKPQASDYCVHPSLTLYGSAVPDVLFATITERTLHNGLLARCLIADCGVRQQRNKAARWSEPPQDLVDAYREIFGGLDTVGQDGEYTRTLLDQPRKARDDMRIVRIASDADARLDEIIDECDADIAALNYATGKSGEQAILSRRAELTKRCAMVYAISQDPQMPMITVDAVNWAYSFVRFCQEGTLRLVDLYAAQNATDDKMKRVRRLFARKPEVTAREIYRNLRLSKREVEEVLDAMVACGDIIDVDDGHRYKWVGK